MSKSLKISTHPNQSSLDLFVEGGCDRTEALLLEAHVLICDGCSQYVAKKQEHLGDELEQGAKPLAMSKPKADLLLNQILDQIDSIPVKNIDSKFGIPEAIYESLPDQSTWKWFSFWPAKGKVARLVTDINGEYELYIGVLEGSSKTPNHDHNFSEQTMPLVGEYVSSGKVFRRGEWSEMTVGESHEPSSVEGGHCVCLIRSHKSGTRFLGASAWRQCILVSSSFLQNLLKKFSRLYAAT